MFVDGLTILIFVLCCAGLFALLNSLLGSGADQTLLAPGTLRPPGPLSQILAASIPQAKREIVGIEKELRQAGYYERFAIQRYLATRNGALLLVVALTLGAVVGVVGDPRATSVVIVIGLLAFGCFYGLPRLYLERLARERVNRIQQGLPDALDTMTMCITAGLPLREALAKVCEEIRTSQPDIGKEFEIIRAQAEAGSMTQALRQFAERTGGPDIRSLASIIGQTERLGTNVAIALRDYADNVRQASRQRLEERVSRLSIKMLFPIIFCLAPPAYIVLCGPPILQLADFITRKDNRADKSLIPPPPTLSASRPTP
ncbi:MAG: type II secretion system F family protein [Planctomycetota bacterium]|nr:type II secretion system F family protein [Planctomycetota bacterium]